MLSYAADIARLSLMIERLLDAELLLAEEGAALLAEVEAASRLLEEGDAETAQRHIHRVVLYTEELLRSEGLDTAQVQALRETTTLITTGGRAGNAEEDR
jgi:hypothetical protein